MFSAMWTVASVLALGITPAYSAIIERAEAPGPAACANITSALGNSKTSTRLSFAYAASKREYWNTRQSEYEPSCVVYPETAEDVSAALIAIKATKSRFAIKTAGHNPNTFFSSVDEGVLLDLNKMTERTYDEGSTLGSFQPGGTFGDIYEYYAQFGRTVVGARLGGVGTGLALGGGLSFLSTQYGMACDSFRELEVVLPSGEIVTASPTENEDLFFADRGGGGNAYGVVTKYTVQTRPAGTFWAGNMIYLLDRQDKVLQAISDFTKYNTDPKASIIGTYQKMSFPQIAEALGGIQLDQVIIMFLVYDGSEADAGNAFANFTAIPSLMNTLGEKEYTQVVNMPTPLAAELSKGQNMFRVQAHRLDDNSTQVAFDAWNQWCEDNKGKYSISSMDFQPVPKSLTDASAAQNGGNAMQLPDGPWTWINYLLTTPPRLSQAEYDDVQASFRDLINSTPNGEGLPLFINDANKDQNPLQTFSTFSRLQEIKRKYDPDNFFAEYTGGWSFE